MTGDHLVDAIVYQLYGLSEEERAIMEGKNVKDADLTNLP
jgi:hypothetical protein